MEKLKLLVADDVEMNRSVISKFLKKEFDVVEASDGLEAIEVLKKEKIDLLLLDIIMPGMNGLEVLDVMQETPEWKGIGVLVATSTKEKTERMALSKGADDVVSKPYDPIVIRKRLENIVAKKRLEKITQEVAESNGSLEVKTLLLKKYGKVLKESSDQMNHIIQIIKMNCDNQKLVEELTVELEGEVKKLEVAFVTDQGQE